MKDAVRNHVRTTFEALEPIAAETPDRIEVGLEQWERQPDGSFCLIDRRTVAGWVHCLGEGLRARRDAPEFAAAVAALASDPVVARHF